MDCPEVLACIRYQYVHNKKFAVVCNTIVDNLCHMLTDDQKNTDVYDLSTADFMKTAFQRFALYDEAKNEDIRVTAVAAKFVCSNQDTLLLVMFILSTNPSLTTMARLLLTNTIKLFNAHNCFVMPLDCSIK